MSDLVTRIGRAIRLRRRALGYSQQDLAAKCGLSKTYIARLELASDKRKENPSVQIVESVAAALECDVEDLIARRPVKKLLEGTKALERGRLLSEIAEIRTEHVSLLVELAQALKELAQRENES